MSEQRGAGSKTIYFVFIFFAESVWIMGGGWGQTDTYCTFAVADNPAAAEAATRRWCDKRGLSVRRMTVSEADKQDESLYVFPEKFIRDDA